MKEALTSGASARNNDMMYSPKFTLKIDQRLANIFWLDMYRVEEKYTSAPYIIKIRTFLEIPSMN